MMNFSYWEHKTWLSNIDFAVVGSGIVGLSTAIHVKEKYPKARILVLEKGILPQGASTKNAGFACFGSISEVIADLESHDEATVFELVKSRWEGIKLLKNTLGETAIDFQQNGGHELFLEKDAAMFERCYAKMHEINNFLAPIFQKAPFQKGPNTFHFGKILPSYITHQFEGQIDTGKMMKALLLKAQQLGILVLNGVEVKQLQESSTQVHLNTNIAEIEAQQVLVTTNGFASKLLSENVKPARAQVLITSPIDNLSIKGTFHFDEGYYYFRNIDNRILFGGGRNLDFKGEETDEFGQTKMIQQQLEKHLKEVILPNTPFEITHRWSGIMGVGNQKKPIIKATSNRIFCGVRMGGMGIAIGSNVGKQLAEMV